MNATVPAVTLNLTRGAAELSRLCERIDDGEPLTAILKETFDLARLQLEHGVDDVIELLEANRALRERLKGIEDAAKAERKRLEEIDAASREAIKATLTEHDGLPFAGSLGRISLKKSPPAVATAFGDKKLDPTLISMFGIPERFIRVTINYALDAKAVKDALEAGKTLPWAELKAGQHVEIRR